jgi:hypothetical protein
MQLVHFFAALKGFCHCRAGRALLAGLMLGVTGSNARAETPQSPWDDYQIIMYQEQTPQRWEGLRALGVTAGKVIGSRAEVFDASAVSRAIEPLLQAKMPWYVENIATDFYAAYHRWTPEHPNDVNWRFLALQAQHRRDRADRSVFIREPSLSDPTWLQHLHARLADNVRFFAPYRPLYYNLADEAGIADLAAAWDFDFSPFSLVGFRDWLRDQYGSLAALNAEWDTHYGAWDEVVPPTTTEAMWRADQNFSAWADFKTWMDEAFARALRAGADAVHAADPAAVAAIEGAQIPGWGGYDYTRLAHAVDLMEIGDAGNNVEIVRSLNPAMKLLTTSFAGDAAENHRIWHELLLGGRGLIIWDEGGDFVDDEGRPGPRVRAVAPAYAELHSGIAAQLIAAAPHFDPVAILYSPACFRTFWMLSERLKGDAWTGRSSAKEAEDNALRASVRQTASRLVHLGIAPRFISPAQVERGELRTAGLRALLLPYAIALSDAEVSAIRDFIGHGGAVAADIEPGTFDQHSRRRASPPLVDLHDHGIGALPQSAAAMTQFLEHAAVAPLFRLTHGDGSPAEDVDVRVFDDDAATIVALQRDLPATGPPAAEAIQLTFAAPVFVHDMRGEGRTLTDHLSITLDGITPTLLVLARSELPPPEVAAPAIVHAGESAEIRLTGGAVNEAVHVDIVAPDGRVAQRYSGNTVLRDGSAVWSVRFGAGDAGHWTVRTRALLRGGRTSVPLEVR